MKRNYQQNTSHLYQLSENTFLNIIFSDVWNKIDHIIFGMETEDIII